MNKLLVSLAAVAMLAVCFLLPGTSLAKGKGKAAADSYHCVRRGAELRYSSESECTAAGGTWEKRKAGDRAHEYPIPPEQR